MMFNFVAKDLPGLRLILPGDKYEWDWQPRFLGEYSFSSTRSKTLPIVVFSTMKYDCQ